MNNTHPYEKVSVDFHLEITEAISPANNAVQSKNIWKESEIKPRLKNEKKIAIVQFKFTRINDK